MEKTYELQQEELHCRDLKGCQLLPLDSLSQLLPLPPPRLWDGWPPGPGPPKSDGRTKVAGIMGLLKPLQGLSLSPGTSGASSCGAGPWTLPLWRKLPEEPEELLPAGTKLQGRPRTSPSARESRALRR